MKTSKAYIAGLGTTGVLIGSFVLLLLVGSALVAFNGLPGSARGDDLERFGVRSASGERSSDDRPDRAARDGRKPARGDGDGRDGARGGRAEDGRSSRSDGSRDGSGDALGGAPGGSAPRRGAPGGGGSTTDGGGAGGGGGGSDGGVTDLVELPGTGESTPQVPSAGDVTSDVGGTVEDVGGQVRGTVEQVSPELGDVVTDTGGQLGDTVDGVGQTVDETVESLPGLP